MDEFNFINILLTPLTRQHPETFALTDDAARLPPCPKGQEWLIASDTLIAGVHCFPDDAPQHIAAKLLAINLSDMAAMGATPHSYQLCLTLPRNVTAAWLEAFANGLGDTQLRYNIYLSGGDTTAHDGTLVASITMLGQCEKGACLQRSGAQPGDVIYVSGTLGDAALGLMLRKGQLPDLPETDRDYLLHRYLLPEPRIALGQQLRGIATSAMDISDGLLADLQHLCHASGVGADVQYNALPRSAAAHALETRY
ncbi:MAG: thiamine-phosphate kinase, partial [Rickettsiales bacterium]|nr:thiamine-phosphate kinase [Rickettsiales bacterium]